MVFPFARSGRRLVGAFVLVLACAPSLRAQRQNGELVGRVLSGDVAVPAAAILVSGGRLTIARADGRFRMSLPPGRYEVRAQRIGYVTRRDTVTVVSGRPSTLNFRLERVLSMLQSVATLGTRVYERAAIDVPAPVDVLQAAELRASGRMETSRMLQSLAPSINAPRGSFAEGSDLVHPLTMRALGPDQVLVLVNGRRRHSSALLNVNGTTGHGSTGVDVDAIPAGMIDHVEVLRDGAAAQYGAEAVAGVVNIVLKSGVHGDATTTVGGRVTTFNRLEADVVAPAGPVGAYPVGERSARDGRAVQASVDKGIVFGERGFLHGAFEMRSREASNRALPDPRLQYPLGDPHAAQTGVSQDLVSNQLGDPATRDVALFLNGGNLLSNGLELFANGGASRRTVEAAGIFRRAADAVTNTSAYPNGFLPIIRPTIDDYAGTVGVRGALEDWRWELGTTYGRNAVDYAVRGSQTRTGIAAPSFDAGDVRYGESTTTLELTRNMDFALVDELRLDVGGEFRRESYRIGAAPGPLDIEGFAGFGPSQAVAQSRHDVSAHADVEADVGPDLLVGLAGRVERYSDVGTLGAGKLSLRWNPLQGVALRGSVGRSQRAPSLAQSYYGDVLTDPGFGGVQSSVMRVDSPLNPGPRALRPETAMNYSAGIAFETGRAFAFSADIYRIVVDDRVTLLQNLSDGSPSLPYYAANAAHTRTEGVDVNASYGMRVGPSLLRLTAGGNATRTGAYQVGDFGSLGLGRVGLTRLERGQPDVNLLGSAILTQGAFGALLRARHYGATRIAGLQSSTALDQYNAAKTLLDANVSTTVARIYTLTVGADNLLDIYPTRNSVPGLPALGAGNGYYGIFPYNAGSPFGFGGRFVYGRLSIYL